MQLPAEILQQVLSHLKAARAFSTLGSFSQCNHLFYAVAMPTLYETHKLRDDLDYIRLVNTHRESQSRRRPSPLDCIKHLQIAHFPSATLCARIAEQTQAVPLLPNVHTLMFTLASCHSIRWGLMHRYRHTSSLATSTQRISGNDLILQFSRIAKPSVLCVRLNHYSVFDRDWHIFFQTVCTLWKDRLKHVYIHGMEYWLKAFVPGIPHDVFLDIDNVPYRPGTGLMVAQGSAENRSQCVETWAEVLCSMIQDSLERDAQQEEGSDSGTTWTLHCPGARLIEILESEEILEHKLRVKCGPLYERQIGNDPPLLRFVTAEAIPCGVCGGRWLPNTLAVDGSRLICQTPPHVPPLEEDQSWQRLNHHWLSSTRIRGGPSSR